MWEPLPMRAQTSSMVRSSYTCARLLPFRCVHLQDHGQRFLRGVQRLDVLTLVDPLPYYALPVCSLLLQLHYQGFTPEMRNASIRRLHNMLDCGAERWGELDSPKRMV